MTSDEQRMREIERQERWFREVCRDPEPPDIDRVKRRVQVAVNEQWMAGALGEQAEAAGEPELSGLVDRTKQAVREAVTTERARQASSCVRGGGYLGTRRILRLAAGIGLAAAACFVVYIGVLEPRAELGGRTFDRLAAFEAFEEDDLGLSLAGLDDDMSEVELASSVSTLANVEDELLEELFDSVDDLMLEGETDSIAIDWS